MSLDKWTRDLWTTMTPSELLSGLETITQPPATALLAQVGITGPSSSNPSGKGLNILDNGTGMAQLPEMLFKEVGGTGWQGKVTLGDVEEDFLRATREKVEKNGWKGVEVKRLDTMNFDVPDDTFTHVLSNIVYIVLTDPIKALKESLRILKPGGTLGFTTFAHSGPYNLLLQAQSLIPFAPNIRTLEAQKRLVHNGYWHDQTFILHTLQNLGLEEINIQALHYRHSVSDAKEGAKMVRPAVKGVSAPWEDPAKQGWEVFEKIEEVLRAEYGDGPVGFWSVALIVTAKKPA